jgi:hypothetical protein
MSLCAHNRALINNDSCKYEYGCPIRGGGEGGFSRYIGPGPGEPSTTCESLKGSIALAIDILFWFV